MALAKSHLLVSHSSDDTLIETYLWAAIEEVESRGTVALINQSRRQYVGPDVNLAGETLALAYLPIVSITGVSYIDTDGETQTLASSNYRLTTKGVLFGANLPQMVTGPDKLWVDYVAGYGDAATNVPQAWVQCVLFLTMRKYELRGDDIGKFADDWERAFDRLVMVAGANLRGY